MKDRWVGLFALFCVLQLPYYVWLGRGPLAFDAAIKGAETSLTQVPQKPENLKQAKDDLDSAQRALQEIGGIDSRQARLELSRALLAWNQGRLGEADGFFHRSLEIFAATHGPDSFHAAAVSLRYAEFLMLTRRYPEALPLMEQGVPIIQATLGPTNAFAVRMVFRRVTMLTYLGRRGEATVLASKYSAALLRNAGLFDESFLVQTGGVLDILSREADLARPTGVADWREALDQARREGLSAEGAASDDG